eukprot:jgi/Ulvmu1/3207/UM015_0248.1
MRTPGPLERAPRPERFLARTGPSGNALGEFTGGHAGGLGLLNKDDLENNDLDDGDLDNDDLGSPALNNPLFHTPASPAAVGMMSPDMQPRCKHALVDLTSAGIQMPADVEVPEDHGSPLMQLPPSSPIHPPPSAFNINMYLEHVVTPITYNDKQGLFLERRAQPLQPKTSSPDFHVAKAAIAPHIKQEEQDLTVNQQI